MDKITSVLVENRVNDTNVKRDYFILFYRRGVPVSEFDTKGVRSIFYPGIRMLRCLGYVVNFPYDTVLKTNGEKSIIDICQESFFKWLLKSKLFSYFSFLKSGRQS